jgi:tape measure domain-containing protein
MAIELEIRSNSKQAKQDLASLNRSVDNISRSAERTGRTVQKAVAIIGTGLAAALTARSVTAVSDRFKNIENRIALVTGRTEELTKTFGDLQKVALRSRGSLDGVADLYNRLARSSQNLNIANSEIIKVTESIQKAIVISGADSAAANAAIVQLGQGLAAGALRGQELNSVMEQTPRVAAAIAAELGVGIGELRKLAEQGKITSEVVISAFQNQREVIEQEFSQLGATTGQGFEQAGQSVGFLVSEFVKGSQIIDKLNTFLLTSAEKMLTMGDAARTAGVAFGNFFSGEAINSLLDSAIVQSISNLGSAFFNLGNAVVRLLAAGVDRIIPIELLLAAQRLGASLELLTRAILPRMAITINRLANVIGRITASLDVFRSTFERSFASKFARKAITNINGALLDFGITINLVAMRVANFGSELAFTANTAIRYLQTGIAALVFNFRNLLLELRGSSLTDYFEGGAKSVGLFGNAIQGLARLTSKVLDGLAIGINFFYAYAFSRPLKSLTKDFGSITKQAKSSAKSISRSFSILSRQIYEHFDGIENVYLNIASLWSKIFSQLGISAFQSFPVVVNFIRRNLNKIKEFFYDAYMAIVGNSYWNDTIEGVVNKTKELSQVTKYIKSWSKSVKNGFKRLYKDVDASLDKFKDKISDFRFNENSFERGIRKLREKLKNGLDRAGELSISVVNLTINTAYLQAAIVTAVSEGISVAVDYLSENFPQAFAAAGGLAVSLLTRSLGLFSVSLVAITGNAIASGLVSADQIATSILIGLKTLAAGAGRILGALFAPENIVSFVVTFTSGLFSVISEFGKAFINEFGIIGKFAQIILAPFNLFGDIGNFFVGSLLAAIGALNLGPLIFGTSGFKGAFGSALAKAATAGFDQISYLINALGLRAGKAWAVNLTEVFTFNSKDAWKRVIAQGSAAFDAIGNVAKSVFSGDLAKILASSSGFIGKISDALSGLSVALTLATQSNNVFIASLAAKLAAVIASIKALGAQALALAVSSAAAIKAGFSNGILAGTITTLTVVSNIATVAFRTMWMALAGPIGFIIAGLGVLYSIFGSSSAIADDYTGSVQTAQRETKSFYQRFLEWVEGDYSLAIQIEVQDADTETIKESVDNLNNDLLNAQRAQSGRWFSDLRTSFEKAWIYTGQKIANGVGRIFTENFRPDTRTITQLLADASDQIDFIKVPFLLNTDPEQIKDALGQDGLDALEAANKRVSAAIAQQRDLQESFLPVSKAKLAIAEREVQEARDALEIELKRAEIAINSNKALEKLSRINKIGTALQQEGVDILGEQLFSLVDQLDLLRLSAKEQRKVLALYREAEEVQDRIQRILGNSKLTDEERSTQIAVQLRTLQNIDYQLDTINDKMKAMTSYDLGEQAGFSFEQIIRFTDQDQKRLTDAQQALNEAAFVLKQLQEAPAQNIEAIKVQQEKVEELKEAASDLSEEFSRQLNTSLQNTISDLGLLGVTAKISELAKVDEQDIEALNKFALGWKGLKEVLDDLTAEDIAAGAGDSLVIAMAELAQDATNAYAEATRNNFDKILAPFQEIGINFDVDDFQNLAKTYSEDALAEAKRLSEERVRILNTEYGTEAELRSEIAKHNKEIADLEEGIAKAREDSLATERFSQEIGDTIAGGIMDVFKGNKSIGEVIAQTITDTMANSLQKRLASFFEGFINSVLDSLSSKEGGIGSFIQELIMPPSNAQQDEIKDLAANVAGSLGAGSEEGSAEDNAEAVAEQKSIFKALPEQLSNVFGGFKDGIGGIFSNLLGGLGNIFSSIGGGIGGIFSAIGGLFFHNGGLVPDGGGYHKLNGGEMVLTEAQQTELFAAARGNSMQSSSNQVVNNINITGDISRQTKKEIVQMLPTIAGGVNQYNRENSR